MPEANPLNYEAAAHLIAHGAWRVNAEAGELCGKRGHPFKASSPGDYVRVHFCDPINPRIRRKILAHRVIWESVHGPLDPTITINHIDGDKSNNRLANLEPLTVAENSRHAWRTGLVKGHTGASNGNALLTDGDAREIYARAWAGEDHGIIGADYGVQRGSVSDIKRGKVWRHATGHAA